MKESCTVIREGNALYVRYTGTKDSEPVGYHGFWPVCPTRSIAAHRLVGCVVHDPGCHGIFTIMPDGPQPDNAILNYWVLKECKAVLIHNARTEATRIDYFPVNRPKVRTGVEVRWYQGEWQKLLKRGWVSCAK